jgi:hypothetical protein
MAVGCDGLRGIGSLGEPIENESPSRLEGYTGIHVPDTARGVHTQRRQAMTKEFVFMRFELDASSLSGLLQSSGLSPPAPGPVPENLAGESDAEWWTPARIRHPMVSKDLDPEDCHHRTVLVDEVDPAHVLVYVYAMT